MNTAPVGLEEPLYGESGEAKGLVVIHPPTMHRFEHCNHRQIEIDI